MRTLIKLALFLKSDTGKKTVMIIACVILSPIILIVVLIASAGTGAAEHNQQVLQVLFKQESISENMPADYRSYLDSFTNSFQQIQTASDRISEEIVEGSLDQTYMQCLLFSLFVDADRIPQFNYDDYILCFLDEKWVEVIIEDDPLTAEDESDRYWEFVGYTVNNNQSENMRRIGEVCGKGYDADHQNIFQEIIGQVNNNFGEGTDAYSPMLELLKAAIEISEQTEYIGGDFGEPLKSGWKGNVTSEFGSRQPITLPDGTVTSSSHTGIDLRASAGTDILAVADGTVVLTQNTSVGLGLYCVIDHGGGIFSVYGHTSRLLVTEGQTVARGEVIANVGQTGYATGPHLHFEVISHRQRVNPRNYLP